MSKWMKRGEFEKLNKTYSVWITYEGRVEFAHYLHERRGYYFDEFSTGSCFLAECITHVQPIERPEYPVVRMP